MGNLKTVFLEFFILYKLKRVGNIFKHHLDFEFRGSLTELSLVLSKKKINFKNGPKMKSLVSSNPKFREIKMKLNFRLLLEHFPISHLQSLTLQNVTFVVLCIRQDI